MTYGSLFAGIGGMDLGLDRAGLECRWQVEIDPFARRVLAKNWPNVQRYNDVRGVEIFDQEGQRLVNRVESVDVLAGGFPCQDISTAGQGIGIIGERSGLWKEFARVIAEIRPRFVFAENVPALRGRGLAMVLQDLWALGYDAEWHCIPACSLGAPHERDRIWIVAYPAGVFRQAIICGEPERTIRRVSEDADADGGWELQQEGAIEELWGRVSDCGSKAGDDADAAGDGWGSGRPGRLDTGYSWQREQAFSNAYADCSGCDGRTGKLRPGRRAEPSDGDTAANANGEGLEIWLAEPGNAGQEQPAVERSDSESPDAYSEPLVRAAIARGERSAWTVEPGVVRMVHGIPNRVDRLRGLGNSVVPQLAEWIGRRIKEAHERA
jgi:DNA (cytosine-5)-methyltransferase 1